EVIRGRRRTWSAPLQRSGAPRISRRGASAQPAVYEVIKKDELHRPCQQCRDSNELVNRDHRLHGIRDESLVATDIPGKSQIVKRHESAISAYERQHEVGLTESLVHHAAVHFRKPKIGARKDSEYRRDPHDHVKVPNYEISGVKHDVEAGLRQKKS